MAGTTPTVGPQLAALVREHNKLVTDVETLRAQLIESVNGDLLLSAPTLAIGTTSAAEVKHADLIFQIDGMRYRIAAGEVAFTATDHDIADPDAAPREAVYVLSAGAGASTVTITKGTDAAADAAVAPATPAGHVKFGEVKVQHNGSAIFNATTDLLSAAHLTDTYTSATPYAPAAATLTAATVAWTYTT
jgi:hypothetical protein